MSSPLAIDRAEDIPQYIHAQGSMNHCRQPSLHIIYYPGCVQSGQVGIMGCLWECRYTPRTSSAPTKATRMRVIGGYACTHLIEVTPLHPEHPRVRHSPNMKGGRGDISSLLKS